MKMLSVIVDDTLMMSEISLGANMLKVCWQVLRCRGLELCYNHQN